MFNRIGSKYNRMKLEREDDDTFFVFALINFWIVMFSKKSFGVTLPATLTGVTLLTYFGQFFFHTFDVGVYVCIGIAADGVALLIVRRKDYDFISRCFSVVFCVFDHVQSMTLNLDVFMPLFYVALIVMISDKELRKSGLGFIMLLLGQFGLIITKQISHRSI